MNENNSSSILPDQSVVLAAEDTSAALDPTGETVTYGEVVENRLFLTTSFEEYTVTEGFMLLFLLIFFVALCAKILKGGFYWL